VRDDTFNMASSATAFILIRIGNKLMYVRIRKKSQDCSVVRIGLHIPAHLFSLLRSKQK